MKHWIDVAALGDIPRLGARVVTAGGVDIAIFRTAADEVFALRNECPHRNGPLSEGLVHDTTVTCPLHNWKIDLATGAAKAPDEGCTTRYPVVLENGRIHLCLLDRESAA